MSNERVRDAIRAFARVFWLRAEEIDVDGVFFAGIKEGADAVHHGWIVAEDEEPGRILYVSHEDEFGYDTWMEPSDTGPDGMFTRGWQERIIQRKRDRIKANGFTEDEARPVGDDLSISVEALERMMKTGVDPYGRSIIEAIGSWAP